VAATLDLGWKPQDREQLVHQLTQAVRYLLEPFRIPCAQEGEPRTQIPTGDMAVLLGQRLKEPKLLAAEAALADEVGRRGWLD
jgi:hypothetical protein